MGLAEDLPLFAASRAATPPQPSPLKAALSAVVPDELSPRDAHELLYRLKRLVDEDR